MNKLVRRVLSFGNQKQQCTAKSKKTTFTVGIDKDGQVIQKIEGAAGFDKFHEDVVYLNVMHPNNKVTVVSR